MIRNFMSVLLLVSLVGCSAIHDLPSGYSLDGQDASEGLAVVSLTLSGTPLTDVSTFEYRLRRVPAGTGREVQVSPRFGSALQHARWVAAGASRSTGEPARVRVKHATSGDPLDIIESGKAVGRVAVLRLPPGTYELYDWTIAMPAPHGWDDLSPKRSMAFRFEIIAGRASYLGNLDLRIDDQGSYELAVGDRASRDLALVAQRFPFLGTRNVVHQPGELRH